MTVKNDTAQPVRNPTVICDRLCWRSIMRLLPTTPAKTKHTQSHIEGLNMNISENAMTAPVTPPVAAEWVDIFHQTFIMAQTICMRSAAMSMLIMKWGVWSISMM